jgi:hypothetical protein
MKLKLHISPSVVFLSSSVETAISRTDTLVAWISDRSRLSAFVERILKTIVPSIATVDSNIVEQHIRATMNTVRGVRFISLAGPRLYSSILLNLCCNFNALSLQKKSVNLNLNFSIFNSISNYSTLFDAHIRLIFSRQCHINCLFTQNTYNFTCAYIFEYRFCTWPGTF